MSRSKVYILAKNYITHSNDLKNKFQDFYQLQLDHQLLNRHNQYISSKKYNASNKSVCFSQKVYEKT